jgi:DNA-binding response OmpR family regulator
MVEKITSVLFADRDLEWSRDARDALRRRGISVFAARTTREVLRMARQHLPDVVVLDEGLEEMGVEVSVDLLRAQSPRTRVVLMTSEAAGGEPVDRGHLQVAAKIARPAPAEPLLAAIDEAARMVPAEGPRSPLILCVDDDPAFLRGLSRLLRRHGYDVLPFESPESALAAVPFVKPDLFILDVRMPGMNGLDLAAEIREQEGEAMPMVFLTAAGSDEEITRGYQSGATQYLVKPCDPQAVVVMAEELLGKGSA